MFDSQILLNTFGTSFNKDRFERVSILQTIQYNVHGRFTQGQNVSWSKPCSSIGIEFFGPMLVKRIKKARSNAALVKRYAIIFTCMTVQAVHLRLSKS